MSVDVGYGPVLTAARCDVPGCSTDVRAQYLARSWQEAANLHAADLVAAGWRISGEYRCPRCVPETTPRADG